MDHNPHLKSRSLPEPNQVAGKGQIEKPCEVENIIHQTRPAPPTEYENQLGRIDRCGNQYSSLAAGQLG